MKMQDRLNRIFNECYEQLKAINIPVGKVGKVVLVHKFSIWGRCVNLIDEYKIEIDSLLVEPKYERGLRTVILHELLHTCPGCISHTPKWKQFAKKVTDTYGYTIQVSDDYYQLGISTKDYIKYLKPKYAFKCMDCGMVVVKSRACHMTKHYILYKCSRCGGFLLRIPENELKKMKG